MFWKIWDLRKICEKTVNYLDSCLSTDTYSATGKKKKENVTSTAFWQYKQAKAQEDIVNEFKSIARLPDVFNWIICTEVKDFHFYND